jgi:hypothetical protein
MEFWVMTPCVVEMFPFQSSLRQQHNVYGVMCQNIVNCFYLSQGPKVTSCGQGKEHYGSIKGETFMISKATASFQLQINPMPNIKYHYLIIIYGQSICVLQ